MCTIRSASAGGMRGPPSSRIATPLRQRIATTARAAYGAISPRRIAKHALILQPHLLELGRGRPSLLVVAALSQGLLVAPPGGPMPDMIRADGMAEPLDGEEAPYLGH